MTECRRSGTIRVVVGNGREEFLVFAALHPGVAVVDQVEQPLGTRLQRVHDRLLGGGRSVAECVGSRRGSAGSSTGSCTVGVSGPAIVRNDQQPRKDVVVEPEQELTFSQKAKIGFQAAGAFARNPKALVALVKYQLAERKR
jgi:hypothetical protein